MSLRSLVVVSPGKTPLLTQQYIALIPSTTLCVSQKVARTFHPTQNESVPTVCGRTSVAPDLCMLAALITDLLKRYAGLNPASNVLEVGCGCGRNAQGLAEFLDHGN